MKLLFFVFTFNLFGIIYCQKIDNNFKSDLDFGNGLVFTTFLKLNFSSNDFSITSPKRAVSRIVGFGKSTLGALLRKTPKNGVIMIVKGNRDKDSLFGQTKIPLIGELTFKGKFNDTILNGYFFVHDTIQVGTVSGKITLDRKQDNSRLYKTILDKVTNNIFSKEVLKTKDWKRFQRKLKKTSIRSHDDLELFLGYNLLSQNLPFTHLSFFISEKEVDLNFQKTPDSTVFFEEKSPNIAYIRIKDFLNSKTELSNVFPKIIDNKNYTSLIIDLRNNPGGVIDPAFELGKYITTNKMKVGYFITNKFKYTSYDSIVFGSLPDIQPKSNKEFTDLLQSTEGVSLVFN